MCPEASITARAIPHRAPRVFRPIAGFGPVGWTAAVIGLTAVGLTAAGVDLQFVLLNGIFRTLGLDAVFAFVTTVMPSAAFTLCGTSFSFVPLAGALAALHIHPRRRTMWITAALCTSSTAYMLGGFHFFIWLKSATGWGPTTCWWIWDAAVLLVAAFVLYRATRSRLIAAVYLLWIPVSLAAEFIQRGVVLFAWTPGAWAATIHDWTVLTWLVLGGVPIAWAIRERRRANHDLGRVCDACGYPREGLRPDAHCPECGTHQAGPMSPIRLATQPHDPSQLH